MAITAGLSDCRIFEQYFTNALPYGDHIREASTDCPCRHGNLFVSSHPLF